VHTHLDLGYDYANAGLLDEAIDVLSRVSEAGYPMVLYSLAVFHDARGERDRASKYLRGAYEAPPQYCFPARLEEMQVLQSALQLRPDDAKAHYYLGNLLYDKRRYAEAIQHWERSCELEASFSIPWRNLGIARYNVQHDAKGA